MNTKSGKKVERNQFANLGVATGRVRKKRSENSRKSFLSNTSYASREKDISDLHALFGLIDGFKLMFEEAGDTNYRSDEIGLAEELGFIGRFSREEVITLLARFRSNRIQPSRNTMGTSPAVTVATGGYPNEPHVPVAAEILRSAEAGLVLHMVANHSRSGMMADLEKAIEVTSGVLAGIPANHADRGLMLASLGTLLARRYMRLGQFQDLQNGIQRLTEAKAHIPCGGPDREQLLFNLSSLLRAESQQNRTPDSLKKAIEASEEALLVIPKNSPLRGYTTGTLGDLLRARYEMFRHPKDLENAIKHLKRAIEIVPRNSPNRVTVVKDLCSILYAKDQWGQSADDRDQAIEQTENVVAVTPDSAERVVYLDLLGLLLSSRFEQRGNLQDLEQGINRAREALDSPHAEGSMLVKLMTNLSNGISLKYDLLGGLGDLEESIKLAEEAATRSIPGKQKAPLLFNLSNRLLQRYQRLGAYEDLDKAIKQGEEALEGVPANHPDRAEMLVSLSSYISHRSEVMGMLEDLERAIKLCGEGVVSTPSSDPKRAQRLSSLSMLRFNRFKRLQTIEDLSDAIRTGREAMEAATEKPHWPSALRDIAIYLHARHEHSGRLEDLQEAIEAIKVALAITPVEYPRRPWYLETLATCLSTRYRISGNPEDVEEAIRHIKEAVAATPTGAPVLENYLHSLTYLMVQRLPLIRLVNGGMGGINDPEFLFHGRPGSVRIPALSHGNLSTMIPVEDYQYLLSLNLRVWGCTTFSPVARLVAANTAASILLTLDYLNTGSSNTSSIMCFQELPTGMEFMCPLEAASCMYENALELLPRVSPRFAGRGDQQRMLSLAHELASVAALVASMSGKEPAHCLKLLELGRGVIYGLVMDCRSDLSELHAQRPDLAARFNSLRMQLDSPMPLDEPDIHTYERGRDRRVQAALEFDEALAAIRNLPNFERFQMPPTSRSLIAMAQEGPIITINCGPNGTEAYIVSGTGIKSLQLSALGYCDAIKRMRELRKIPQGKRSTYAERNQNMADFLLWLWDVAVEPICDVLQLHPASGGDNLPRIWWIGVGPLAMAPFHAAGDHSPGSTRNTFSRAISSYISTIKALSYARQGELELLHAQDPNLLIVTMPKTPGQGGDLKAAEEASRITDTIRRTPRTVQIKVMERPAADAVLGRLPSYQAVHFACHGVSDIQDPSRSRLLLFKDDGSESGTVDGLTVEKASSRNMKKSRAQIAYLSACNTAAHMSEKLTNEPMHIANGFQLAGFPHVLATLWKSEDSACQVVAAEFYHLLFDGNGDQGHSKVSHSFHHATLKLRETLWRQPIRWASFIHTGA